MRVLLSGLSESSAHVIETLATAVMPEAAVCRQDQGQPPLGAAPAGGLDPRDICIVDLTGLGLAQWSRARQEQLQTHLLGHRRALLLAPTGSGGGWLGALRPTAGRNRLVLQKPLSTSALRDALAALRDAGHAMQPPPAQSPGAPAASGPTQDAWEQLCSACPGAGANPYLNLVMGLAVKGTPHEFRIGSQSAGVLHPAAGWVTTNISTGLRDRLMRHPAMQAIVEVSALDSGQANLRAQRLFGRRRDGRRPLDAFLWTLAFHTLANEPLAATGDLHLQLHQFPNFARLPAVPDLFLQLALVCQRGPQRLGSLLQSFPRHDPAQVMLFVACAVASGWASVLPGNGEPPPAPPTTAARKPAPPRSFLRALLSRLF